MSLKSALGLEAAKKVRYAIVALGDIAQASLMPGVDHTGNSVITALVTGDPVKAKEVAKQYNVPPDAVYPYERFAELCKSGKIDAMYIATPNFRHAEFAVPALQAGIHVLLEKPMEITAAACETILAAQKQSKAKLMVAYRLHFEPGTLAVLQKLRDGAVGSIRAFSATFAQNVKPSNHRAHNGELAGPMFDMGVYPLNAVRMCFEAEPIELYAIGSKSADAGLPMDFFHTVTVALKFPGERTAQFTISYVSETIDEFTVMGSKGYLTERPAFGFGQSHTVEVNQGGKASTDSYKNTDHFGGELKYFSDCILSGNDPEPDGEEGLLDVRVAEAIIQSLGSGQPVKLPPMIKRKKISADQVEKLRKVSPPKNEVNAENPGQ